MAKRRFWDILLDVLFPPRCVFCQKLISSQKQGICDECQKELPWLIESDSLQKVEFVSVCVSPLRFQGTVRESIHRYKFYGRSSYAKVYGVLVSQCVLDHISDQFDLISWVPLTAHGLRKRGYDQSRLLAEVVSLQLGKELIPTLRKCRNTKQQSLLTEYSQRKANIMGAYEVTDPANIDGKRILLIDDVVTTGATLSECAWRLRAHGAADVLCATISRAGD